MAQLFLAQARGTNSAGDVWMCGLHITCATATDAQALSAGQAFWEGVFLGDGSSVDGYLSVCTSGVVLADIVVTEIDMSTDRNLGQSEVTENVAGNVVGSSVPPQCSIVVSLRGPLATRSNRGRFYLPPPAAPSLDATGKIASGTGIVVAEAVSYGLAQLEAAEGLFTPVIRHRESHTQTQIVAGNVGNVFDTQRRRRNKVLEARAPLTFP